MKKYFFCFYILVLNLLTAQEILSKSEDSILSCAWSNNGKYFATSWNNSVIIWNAESNTIKAVCSGHKTPVISIVFSKTDNYFLTVAEDNSIITRSLDNLFKVEVFESENTYSIKDADFSDKGYSIIFPAEDYNITSFYRLILTNQIIRKNFIGHTDLIYALDVNMNESLLLSSSNDGTINLWDLINFEYINSFQNYYESKIPSVFNNDGTLFLYSIDENSIGISEINGNTIKIIKSNNSFLNTAQFSSDSKYIAAATDDGGIEIYDIRTGDLYAKCNTVIENDIEYKTGIVNNISFSPDGDSVLAVTSLGYVIRGSLSGKVLVQRNLQYIDENVMEFAKSFTDNDLKSIKKVNQIDIDKEIIKKEINDSELIKEPDNTLENSLDSQENQSLEQSNEITKNNLLPIQIGYSTLKSDIYVGSINVKADYIYKKFIPLFFGVGLEAQIGLPKKDSQYIYKSGNEELKSPCIYSLFLSFCLGLEYQIPKTEVFYFMQLEVAGNTRFLWNNSFSHSVISKSILGVNAGLSIGLDIYGIRISSELSYDSNFELSIQGLIGYAFVF